MSFKFVWFLFIENHEYFDDFADLIESHFVGDQCAVNIDECDSSPCQGNGSQCEDLVNGYRCRCTAGLTGSHCETPDPEACGPVRCFQGGGACSWNPESGYQCQCQPGWRGASCDINTSGCEGDNACLNGGKCVVGDERKLSCVCADNWTG